MQLKDKLNEILNNEFIGKLRVGTDTFICPNFIIEIVNLKNSYFLDSNIPQNNYDVIKKRMKYMFEKSRSIDKKTILRLTKHYYHNNFEVISFDNNNKICLLHEKSDFFDFSSKKYKKTLRFKQNNTKKIDQLLFPSLDKYPQIIYKKTETFLLSGSKKTQACVNFVTASIDNSFDDFKSIHEINITCNFNDDNIKWLNQHIIYILEHLFKDEDFIPSQEISLKTQIESQQ